MARSVLATVLFIALMSGARAQEPHPVRIWPLGDSITGGDVQHPGYRRNLWLKLASANRYVDFVGTMTDLHGVEPSHPDFDLDHDGHWGWRSGEILAQVDTWAATLKPDIVLLHLGSNDLLDGKTVDSIVKNLANIIQRLRAANPSVAVLVAQIIPYASPDDAVARLNREIGKLSALSTKESPIVIVDQYSGFSVDGNTWDGIHPNEKGAEKMAVRWLDALKPVLASR